MAACFNRTTATYKFYWFLSILQSVESGNLRVTKKELFSRMISNAWYTVNYFNVSFGKQDLIQNAIEVINQNEGIVINEKRELVFSKLHASTNPITEKVLHHFNRNVPHWFLSPWFPKGINETDTLRAKRIYSESKVYEKDCLYSLSEDSIVINGKWVDYLKSNSKFLKDFCYWNLALFLQSKNPNVPDIPNKLIKPALRNSLVKQRTQFWDVDLEELGSVNCIYTGKQLRIGNYAVEHFIPYSFVSHDLIWNLIPADKSFNSSKGNKLPSLDQYFNPFFTLQKSAVEIVRRKKPKSKILQEYFTVLPDSTLELSEIKFREIIQPLISIASNNGFEFMK